MFLSPKRDPDDLRPPLGDWGGIKSALRWSMVLGIGAFAFVAAVALILVGGLWWDRDRHRFHGLACWWGRQVSRFVVGGPFEIRGLDHLGRGPYVITPNHQSVIDLISLYRLPIPYRTMVKRSWFFFTPFGLNMWAAGYVPVQIREGADVVLSRAARWLERGVSVMSFPEGRRSRHWRLARFRRGPFELAVRSGVPVLPIAIAGTNDTSHPSSLRFCRPRRHRIVIEVLTPIAPAEMTSGELRDRVKVVLDERVGTLRRELFET